jgi:hypothetical protein
MFGTVDILNTQTFISADLLCQQIIYYDRGLPPRSYYFLQIS